MPGPTIRLTFAGDSTDLERSMDRVGNAAGQMERTFSAKSAGLAVAGAAAGVGLSSAFMASLDVQDASAKLEAQMGAGSEAAGQAGRIAGTLYSQAYGDSLADVGEAVKTVMQSGALSVNATDEEIQSLTANAMSLSTAFDQDVTGSVNAAAQMLKTGLAPDAKTAMDILTVGFQQGNDKAGDLLDTFNEYGTRFRAVGLDGQTAMGLISQGLQAGARDADKVADAIKEFGIRAIDGSKTTIDGFTSIGLSAQEMSSKIAAGGPGAAQALDTVLDRLRAVKDPVEQARIATELFGTQSEDLGAALFALDPSTATAKLGEFTGATDKLNETLSDTVTNKIESAKRGFQDLLNSVIGVQGPLGSVAAGIVGIGGDILPMVGSLGMAAMALQSFGAFSGIATAAQWLFNAAMSANPIGIVVLAIAALVAGIIWAYNNIGWFKDGVDAVFGWIGGFVSAGVGVAKTAIGWFANLPGLIGGWFGGMATNAIAFGGRMIAWVRGLPGVILSAVGNLGSLLLNAGGDLLRGMWNGILGAAGWLRSKVLGFFGSILPGWAKDILGINSPSTVFRDEIGKWIPEGMAIGIEDNTDSVVASARGMTSAAMNAARVPEISSVMSPVSMSRQQSSSGPTEVRFVGNVEDGLAKLIMNLIRTNKIQIA